MGDVVSFNREYSFASKKKKVKQSTTTESYYFKTLEGATFSFGGAFVRDLISKFKGNNSEVKSEIISLYADAIADFQKYNVDNKKLISSVESVKSMALQIVDELVTPEYFDEIMSTDADIIVLMPMILLISVKHYYSTFDLHRMIKQNWLHIDESVEKFVLSEAFAIIL